MEKMQLQPTINGRASCHPHGTRGGAWVRLLAVVIGLVWATASCGAPARDDPEPPGPTPLGEAELFVQTARESGLFDAVSDDALATAGREVCAALDRGVTPIEVFALATETDLEGGTVIMGTAVGILCRNHLDAVQALAGQL